MKCNIIEGENEKLRSVCFEEIEKIVDHLYEEIIDTEEEQEEQDMIDEYMDYDDNDILCLKMDYEINYLKKDLLHIMKYYKLPTRKKNKSDTIDAIVEFEMNPENHFMVEQRKLMWFYLEELRNDEYLSTFIIKR